MGKKLPPPLPQVIHGHIRINLVRLWVQERKFNNVNTSNKIQLLWCITYCYIFMFSSYHNVLSQAGIEPCPQGSSYFSFMKNVRETKLRDMLMVPSSCVFFAQLPSSSIAGWSDYQTFKTSNRLSFLSVISL